MALQRLPTLEAGHTDDAFQHVVRDVDGNVRDISTWTALRFKLVNLDTGFAQIDAVPVLPGGGTDGIMQHRQTAAQVSVPGRYRGQWYGTNGAESYVSPPFLIDIRSNV